jgi:hypothetical protein
MARDPKLNAEATDLLLWATVHDILDRASEVALIHDRAHGPMQDVVSVNNDAKELAFGYWMLAARARDDVRTLLSHGWGL